MRIQLEGRSQTQKQGAGRRKRLVVGITFHHVRASAFHVSPAVPSPIITEMRAIWLSTRHPPRRCFSSGPATWGMACVSHRRDVGESPTIAPADLLFNSRPGSEAAKAPFQTVITAIWAALGLDRLLSQHGPFDPQPDDPAWVRRETAQSRDVTRAFSWPGREKVDSGFPHGASASCPCCGGCHLPPFRVNADNLLPILG